MSTAVKLEQRPRLQMKMVKLKEIKPNHDVLMELWKQTSGLENGTHKVSFELVYDGSDLSFSVKVWMCDEGIWMYENFIAIDESGNELEVILDVNYFNKYYMD